MGSTFSKLFGSGAVKSSVASDGGSPTFYANPADAANAFQNASNQFASSSDAFQGKALDPGGSMFVDSGDGPQRTINLPNGKSITQAGPSTSDSVFTGGVGSLGNAPVAPVMKTPTFQQAGFDSLGRPTPFSPYLTKGGVLGSLLSGAARGAFDSIASGALNARPGKSSFGAGFQGASEMPYERAEEQAAAERGGLQNELTQEEIAHLPQFYNYQISQTARNNALADQALAHAGRYGELTTMGNMQKRSDGSIWQGVAMPDGSTSWHQVVEPADKYLGSPKAGYDVFHPGSGQVDSVVPPMLQNAPTKGPSARQQNQQMQVQAEQLAAQLAQRYGGDVNAATAAYNYSLQQGKQTGLSDRDYALAPLVRKALRDRRPPARNPGGQNPLPMVSPAQAMSGAPAQ